MKPTSNDIRNTGLRGVNVADTRISHVDGQRGILLYRGYNIRDLAQNSTFEEVIYLLLMGSLPSQRDLEELQRVVGDNRSLPREVFEYLKARSSNSRPMDVVQGAMTVLADHDPDLELGQNRSAVVQSSLRLISRTATVVAAWQRMRNGREPVPPAEARWSIAASLLYGLWGRKPTTMEERLMDLLLVLHAEHTFNASTFSVRQVASTQAHLYASVAAGVGALSGPLHGGANTEVMRMIMEIAEFGDVEGWVTRRIASGQRVMGLGHAVYTVEDPRARILRNVAEQVLAGRPEEKYFRISLDVERVAMRELKARRDLELYPNVDFYSGPILYALGFPVDLFPVFFAVSRTAGWTAHFIEEVFAEAQPKPALYRPSANYIGRLGGPEGVTYVPLNDRRGAIGASGSFIELTEADRQTM